MHKTVKHSYIGDTHSKIFQIEFKSHILIRPQMEPGSLDQKRMTQNWSTVMQPPVTVKPRRCVSLYEAPRSGLQKFKPPPKVFGKKTLVLDMDETLIHSSEIPPHKDVQFFKSGNPEFFVYKRPGLDAFLDSIKDKFEVFVFTHGERNYAEPVLDVLMPWLDDYHRLYRDSCDGKNGPCKNLKLLERDKHDMILVDDSSIAQKKNPKNTIRIKDWHGTPYDTALIDWLPPILEECRTAKDVRPVIKAANKKAKEARASYKAVLPLFAYT